MSLEVFAPPGAQKTLSLVLGLALCQLGALVGVVVLLRVSVARPLADLQHSASGLCRGELQRPVTPSNSATAEIRELQLVFEEMRRALITKLRSSTELNLQLESEVARRSAELSRRQSDLQEALERLRTTRDELLRTEKLAAVGRIAARVTDAIYAPVSTVASLVQSLRAPLVATCNDEALRLPLKSSTLMRLREMDDVLERLLRDALRVRDIVRAMRVYARPGQDATNVQGQGQGQIDGPRFVAMNPDSSADDWMPQLKDSDSRS